MKPRQITCADVMVTAVITVQASETIGVAQADMEFGVFRHLPVLDPHGRLIGILSDRDVLRAMSRPRAVSVAEIMTLHPITVRADTPAHTAAAIMLDRKISSLPVVADDDRLVGLITQTDFLALARRALLASPLVP